ncbi:hypothetical protein TrVE_jg624 [Triparma verrucosa]|uniref:Uncharacterized protein n=2 Tax=Triparma TaxID=722752 RepID=A0A9W7A6P6_9STRA|nr:hypothetical protein TrST_g9279 [Triparma strigata]GMI10859.1 hypothetical protein TrVE_jg624 [Triparma verrucosa]|mmetsp:Transcript_25935/g.48902  ORF Transcript_25935/g.48902 Transcript_25935/m.48902 type:complete len:80 (+) Transcript_25935:340-579(+)
MVVPPQFSLAFKSVIYGTGVGLATTLLSCTLAVAVEKTAINYMYMYKPQLFENTYARNVLKKNNPTSSEIHWNDENLTS